MLVNFLGCQPSHTRESTAGIRGHDRMKKDGIQQAKPGDRKRRLTMQDVTVANYVRAETDHMIRTNMQAFGLRIGVLKHVRAPTTPQNQ
ncbi:MAG: hypothetical protein KDE01_32110, partial [Caldilineaceae bacterium]|nr:hypothetical protein [Caldilineaceae bacterium]